MPARAASPCACLRAANGGPSRTPAAAFQPTRPRAYSSPRFRPRRAGRGSASRSRNASPRAGEGPTPSRAPRGGAPPSRSPFRPPPSLVTGLTPAHGGFDEHCYPCQRYPFSGSMVRPSLVGGGRVALWCGGPPGAGAGGGVPAARRIGLGGLGLDQGSLRRYNAAYRAVPGRAGQRGRPKLTIPIPLGLIQFFHDHPLSNIKNDPAFNHDSAGFNPVELLNTFLNPPLFLEVKKAPTPTNDVVFGIGKDSLRLNLGQTAKLVPEDQFGIGGSSRPLDAGLSIKGVRVGVMGWVHGELGFQLGDKLLGFLRDSVPAAPNTRYNIPGDAVFEAGFPPPLGLPGRGLAVSPTRTPLGGASHSH